MSRASILRQNERFSNLNVEFVVILLIGFQISCVWKSGRIGDFYEDV